MKKGSSRTAVAFYAFFEELLLNFEKKTVAAFTNSIFRKDIPLLRAGR